MWNLLPAAWPKSCQKIISQKPKVTPKEKRKTKPNLEALEIRLNPAFIYAVDNDWGSGFQAHGLLTNEQTAPMANWQVEFDYNRDISSIWDGKIASKVGRHYVIVPESYNSSISVGASVQFGFVGAGGTITDKPSNVVITWDGSTKPPALPALSVADVSLTEGNTGTKNAVFTVSLSAKSASSVTVNYATVNGTAAAGADFASTSGSLTFAPGETTKTISVIVTGDALVESDEVFSLNLTAPSGATISRTTATGTILNDDIAPLALSVSDVTLTEGDSGTKNAVFTVALSSKASTVVTV